MTFTDYFYYDTSLFFLLFLCNFEFPADFFKQVRQWSREYGPVYILSVFYYTVINLSGPDEFEVSFTLYYNIFIQKEARIEESTTGEPVV